MGAAKLFNPNTGQWELSTGAIASDVQSVNGLTGNVVLTPAGIGALEASKVGNLLTANEASHESGIGDTTSVLANATLSISNVNAHEGTKSLRVTSTAAGLVRVWAALDWRTVSAKPGDIITGSYAKATIIENTGANSPEVCLVAYNTGSGLHAAVGPHSATIVCPAATTNVGFIIEFTATDAGQSVDFDGIGIWYGAGGDWAMPGTPITNLGTRTVNGYLEIWNGTDWFIPSPNHSPGFTGNPTAPTPSPGDSDTSIATTAFVTPIVNSKAPIVSPTFTGTPTAPVMLALNAKDAQLATISATEAAISRNASGVLSEAVWWVDADHLLEDQLGLLDLSGRERHAYFSPTHPSIYPWTGETYIGGLGTLPGANYISSSLSIILPLNAYVILDLVIASQGLNVTQWLFYSGDVDQNVRAYIANNNIYLQVYSNDAWNQASWTTVPANILYDNRIRLELKLSATGGTLFINGVSYGTQTWGTTRTTQTIAANVSLCLGWTDGHSLSLYYADLNGQHILDPRKVLPSGTPDTNLYVLGTAHAIDSGESWNIQRPLTESKAVLVNRSLIHFHSDGYYAETNPLNEIGPNEYTVVLLMRAYGNGLASSYLTVGSPGIRGLYFYRAAGVYDKQVIAYNNHDLAWLGDSASQTTDEGLTVLAGVVTPTYLMDYVGHMDTSINRPYPLEPAWVPGDRFRLFGTFEFMSAAVWDRTLTAQELLEVANTFKGQTHGSQVDPHPQYILEQNVGNLLTPNEASLVDNNMVGWNTKAQGANGTLVRSTAWAAHGTASALLTASSTDNVTFNAPRHIPVIANQVYTFTAKANKVGNWQRGTLERLAAVWFDATEAVVGSALAYWRTDDIYKCSLGGNNWSSGEAIAYATAVAPPTAISCGLYFIMGDGGSVGNQFYIDKVGLWEGAGGDWVMPGTPIPNLGTRISHPNVDDVLVERWDTNKNRWQMIHYDSGIRIVSNLLLNGWVAESGQITLRRINNVVYLNSGYINGAGASSDHFMSLPDGFRPVLTTVMLPAANVPLISRGVGLTGQMEVQSRAAAVYFSFTSEVSNSIPQTLPGSLYAEAPYN